MVMELLSGRTLQTRVRELRAHALNKTVVIEMALSDLPIIQLERMNKTIWNRPHPLIDWGEDLLTMDFWPRQHRIDLRKRSHRSHVVYWIWLSKSWWTTQAIAHNFFHSNLYMWQDIGSYRNTKLRGRHIMEHAADVIPKGTILWLAHHDTKPPPTPVWDNRFGENEETNLNCVGHGW